MGAVSVSGTCPDSWGAGNGPWWLEECGLARSPAPHRQGMPAPSGREAGPPSRKASRKPWAVSSRSALRGPNPPSPTRAAEKLHPARQGRVRPASGVTPHRPGGPAGPQNHADRTPPAALQSRRQPVPAIRAKRPCVHPPRWNRRPRWPGQSFASFRPAGTAPANRNSPPPAGPGSVGPGHPSGRKTRPVSHGLKAWGKNGRKFSRAGAVQATAEAGIRLPAPAPALPGPSASSPVAPGRGLRQGSRAFGGTKAGSWRFYL